MSPPRTPNTSGYYRREEQAAVELASRAGDVTVTVTRHHPETREDGEPARAVLPGQRRGRGPGPGRRDASQHT